MCHKLATPNVFLLVAYNAPQIITKWFTKAISYNLSPLKKAVLLESDATFTKHLKLYYIYVFN